jgi:flagellar biosynthesis activator protein FlaF
MQQTQATRAYRAASARRSPREQEADVFRRVNGALRAAKDGTPLDQAKALADNSRLWMMVGDLLRDPDNALPAPLRASIVSVGQALQREMREAIPDFSFLIAVNEDITAGLSGQS